jgi:hypothetical protein
MPTYNEYLQQQKAYNDRDDAAFSAIATSFEGITADFKFLKDTITKLQNSAGQVTPEDQALIDQLQARANTAGPKVEALAKSIKDLDDATPPEPAPGPTPGPTPGETV